MKKQNFEEAGSLELVKVNGSRFAAEVLNGNARINLTQMSQPFGRSCRPGNWLKTDEAQRYLHAISVATKIATADLLEVRQGGDPLEQGTWCRDYRIALRFAQWLSPEFSIKVDEAILGLLTASRGQAQLRRDESRLYEGGATGANPQAAGDAMNGDAMNGDAMNRVSTTRLPIPRKRSAALGAFYAELRKWVLKEDEAAVAELAGVSPGHVAEVLAGRKPGYGVLCLLVEYATENRVAGRQRVVRSAARRAEQVEELRLDFMAGSACSEWHVGTEADMRATGQQTAGSACPDVVLRPEGRRTAGSHETDMRRGRPAANGAAPAETQAASRGTEAGASGRVALLRKGASADKLPSSGDAMNRVSTAKAQDVTDGVIDFNGMEG